MVGGHGRGQGGLFALLRLGQKRAEKKSFAWKRVDVCSCSYPQYLLPGLRTVCGDVTAGTILQPGMECPG